MNVHDLINDLVAQARKIGPVATEQALDSACTNARPASPVRGKAWDLVALAFDLNAVSEQTTDAAEALKVVLALGSTFGSPEALAAATLAKVAEAVTA